MKYGAYLVFAILFACKSTPPAVATACHDDKLNVGQRWTYKTRPQEPNSTAIILRIDCNASGAVNAVHIRLEDVDLPKGPTERQHVAPHVPMDRATLIADLRDMVGTVDPLPEFPGYQDWLDNKGGVFTLPIAKMLDVVEPSLK